MKIITWNINSIRARLPRLLALLERHRPDVLCLQEIKATEDQFPYAALEDAGYHAAVWGQKTYNGVALLAREPLQGVSRGFLGNPAADQARVLAADVMGLRIINLYVINGQEVGSDAYALKLAWLDALAAWLEQAHDPEQPLLLAGDFNIIPEDRDAHDPERWRGQVLFSDAELQRLKRLLSWGLLDLQRVLSDGGEIYSWWDYRFGAFHKGWGLRIDLLLGTRAVARRCQLVEVDREERKKSSGEGNPSDHAPVIAILD